MQAQKQQNINHQTCLLQARSDRPTERQPGGKQSHLLKHFAGAVPAMLAVQGTIAPCPAATNAPFPTPRAITGSGINDIWHHWICGTSLWLALAMEALNLCE